MARKVEFSLAHTPNIHKKKVAYVESFLFFYFSLGDLGNGAIQWHGASYPTSAVWRSRDEPHPMQANINHRPWRDFGHTLGSAFQSNDFFIVLARAPGACAASALRRFGPGNCGSEKDHEQQKPCLWHFYSQVPEPLTLY